jgi:hypothetical protein
MLWRAAAGGGEDAQQVARATQQVVEIEQAQLCLLRRYAWRPGFAPPKLQPAARFRGLICIESDRLDGGVNRVAQLFGGVAKRL